MRIPDESSTLAEFAAIDSTTLNRSGVHKVQIKVGEILNGLGFGLTWLAGEDARFAPLLVAERPAAPSDQPNLFITLVSHADTVLPNYPVRPMRPGDERAFGSGVLDNKGGLVVGLSALERFLAASPNLKFGLRFICSPNEEMGSIGFTDHFRLLGRDTAYGLGLEPALDDGSIIHQRRGNRWYDIEITGKAAHAGRSYGDHANAALALAVKIVKLEKLTNYRADLSLNIGHVIAGEEKHNIVCGWARAKLDARFPSFAARDRLERQIRRILERVDVKSVDKKFQTTTRYAIVDDCPPFSPTRRGKALAKHYAGLVGRIEGRAIRGRPAGGAGDVNYLSTDQNIVLDGLGPVGGEMHTTSEFVHLATLRSRAESLARFLLELQRR